MSFVLERIAAPLERKRSTSCRAAGRSSDLAAAPKLVGDPHPHGPGRLPDRERLLGALLLGARYSAGRADAERQDHRWTERNFGLGAG